MVKQLLNYCSWRKDMFGFQKLEIYNLSKDIVKDNYRLIKKFPSEERFALVQQMSRAAVSIPSNIAEGTSRMSNKEKAHFINIAYGSLMELVCQMEISLEIGYIEQKEYDDFVKKSKNLAVKMSNFIRTIA
ncbi:hypothetical protein Swol_0702 [Syntrophomonas wolfei subsp. wolfei str. Goettingen G311]|uniref:Four helix bundle protein n=2 Tax=Syntrophomonas wolfei TaxID=863 RepID=Q0AZ28_SYNWW|nr:hypothetical protein Swol_0702 [Syntrophomonas wolfei subsp. wolfei str. Goettingen G311]